MKIKFSSTKEKINIIISISLMSEIVQLDTFSNSACRTQILLMIIVHLRYSLLSNINWSCNQLVMLSCFFAKNFCHFHYFICVCPNIAILLAIFALLTVTSNNNFQIDEKSIISSIFLKLFYIKFKGTHSCCPTIRSRFFF